jgi:hypothetical protein
MSVLKRRIFGGGLVCQRNGSNSASKKNKHKLKGQLMPLKIDTRSQREKSDELD